MDSARRIRCSSPPPSLESLEPRQLLCSFIISFGGLPGGCGGDGLIIVIGDSESHAHPAPTPLRDLSATPAPISPFVGFPTVVERSLPSQNFPGVAQLLDVATLTSSSQPIDLSNYSTTIDWGDGAASAGYLVVDSQRLIHVKGFHTYDRAGSFSLTVTLSQSTSPADTLIIHSSAQVRQNSPGGTTLLATSLAPVSGVVATVALPPGATTDPALIKATIKWGDGHSSRGTLSFNPDGTCSIAGDHLYQRPGDYRIVVAFKIRRSAFASAFATASSPLYAPPFYPARGRFIARLLSTASVS